MKVLDFTPFRTEDGQIAPLDRFKSMFKFGMSWFVELEAQDHVVAVLNRQLGRDFTLLRNFTLPGTEVMYTMILVGPLGVYVLNVTNERGVFRAKGNEWGTMEGERFVPARENILKATVRLVALVKKYLEKQELGDIPVEGAILAANPGLHVDSVRPAVRIFMFDALDRFAVSAAQARPVLAHDVLTKTLARLQKPMQKKPVVSPPQQPEQSAQHQDETPAYVPQGLETDGGNSNASGWDSDRMGFGFQDEAQAQPEQPQVQRAVAPRAEHPAQRAAPKPKVKKAKSSFNISTRQMTILGGIFLFWVCLLVVFIVMVVANAI